MENRINSEKCKVIRLNSGVEVTLHYAQDKPSLQEQMIKVMSSYQTKTAKI